jgi:hypothetical protein
MPIIQTLHVYLSKDVKIRGYFSKPKGVREQKSLGNTDWPKCVGKLQLEETCVKRGDYLGDANVNGSILLGENFKAVHEHYLKAHFEVKVLFPSFSISLLYGANDLRHAIGALYPEIQFAVFYE